jgi:hypothetical protein
MKEKLRVISEGRDRMSSEVDGDFSSCVVFLLI